MKFRSGLSYILLLLQKVCDGGKHGAELPWDVQMDILLTLHCGKLFIVPYEKQATGGYVQCTPAATPILRRLKRVFLLTVAGIPLC